jgi:mobilization protein NikA
MAATERIVLQVTPQQKRAIERAAKDRGLTVSEYLRAAAEMYREMPEEDAGFEELLKRATLAARNITQTIDETLARIGESNARIEEMGKKHGSRQ